MWKPYLGTQTPPQMSVPTLKDEGTNTRHTHKDIKPNQHLA